MANTRKLVRDAVVSVLSHATKGFNARLATKATTYGITAFTIDWADGSASFFQGQIADPSTGTQLSLEDSPAILQIYSGIAEGLNRSKPRSFSGTINFALDFTLQYRAGMEQDDIEDAGDVICDAVEDCIFDSTAAWPSGVVLSANFTSEKQAAELLPDGWRQRILEYLRFEVDV